jgi:amino acid permease
VLAEKTLGTLGARAAGALYVFIHYALLVAYMAQVCSDLLHLSQHFENREPLQSMCSIC